MTAKEFFDKLRPFFTRSQIMRLNRFSYEMAVDAFAGDNIPAADLAYIGRDHICECLTCWGRKEIESAAGSRMDDSAWNALVEQFDNEW